MVFEFQLEEEGRAYGSTFPRRCSKDGSISTIEASLPPFFLCIQILSSFHRCQAVVNAWNGNMVELLIKDVSLISEEYPSFRV